MAYIVGTDRYQTRMITTSLDDLLSKDNSVRVIDSYVESLDLENLGFIEYSGRNRGQSPYRRSDLLTVSSGRMLPKYRCLLNHRPMIASPSQASVIVPRGDPYSVVQTISDAPFVVHIYQAFPSFFLGR